MADTKETVASQALARLGEPSISDFTADTDTAEKVNLLYETTILALLSSHDWTFATERVKLVEDAAAVPENEWTRAFKMPVLKTDRVGKPITIFNTGEVGAAARFEYGVQGQWIQTNYTEIWIEYIKRKPEDDWPGYFSLLAIEALASTLALPITENASKEALHRSIAFGSPSQNGHGGMFAQAIAADAIGEPTKGLLDDDDIMTFARFGSRR